MSSHDVPAGDVPAAFTAPAEENPHAGQGLAVVLDIGDDVGAVVLTVPEHLVEREIEIVPEGSRGPGGRYEHAAAADHAHSHDDHAHGHSHDDHAARRPRPRARRPRPRPRAPAARRGGATADG